MHNLNARRLTDGSILIQYLEDGKAKDASFRTWEEFANWLLNAVINEVKTA